MNMLSNKFFLSIDLHFYHIKLYCSMLRSSYSPDKVEAGCDEVGRGCLAGPVVAAAVILPKDYQHKQLNDSKQLSRIKRNQIRENIVMHAISYAIAEISSKEVDKMNVLKASFVGMHRALDQLDQTPQILLIDGNRFIPYRQIPHHCIIKGDGKFMSIAAASVLAKTYRDDLMAQLAKLYPQYGWERNMGYPTREHRDAIAKYGITPYHRKSFRLLPDQQELFK
jgi:ribonuclease HII